MTEKRGGYRAGAGRKQQWYGKTELMRVPADWMEGLRHCMANKITPTFDSVQNQNDNVTQSKYSNEFKQKAVDLLNAGLNASTVCDEMEKRGYTPLLNKKNASRTLKKWLAEKG